MNIKNMPEVFIRTFGWPWPIYSKSTHSTHIAVYDDACSGLMMSLAAALVE
jgi:hypothetical protein